MRAIFASIGRTVRRQTRQRKRIKEANLLGVNADWLKRLGQRNVLNMFNTTAEGGNGRWHQRCAWPDGAVELIFDL